MKTNQTPLTRREAEIIHELSRGLYYKEIAGKIFISTETVKKHVRSIYKKMGVRNRVEATLKYTQEMQDEDTPMVPQP
ncbi:MAG: LuxR family transcriptional regulator [Chitinophagaceae bacterium]|nr:MAG: LuxR family transcriptional regulator [Chitinophagaceae bacterium]